MIYPHEFLIALISLTTFIGVFIYQKSSDKFESVAREIRKIKSISEPEKRLEMAFPDIVNRQKIERMVMKEPSRVIKILRYLIMGIALLIFIAILSEVLKRYIHPFPAIYGKIGSGLATIGVMFISLGSFSVQTFSNSTLAEKLRDFLLFALWTSGTFLLFMSA